jgi:hypothetical protein
MPPNYNDADIQRLIDTLLRLYEYASYWRTFRPKSKPVPDTALFDARKLLVELGLIHGDNKNEL